MTLAEALATVEASADHRVLRHIQPWARRPLAEGDIGKLALFVDCETTGLDHAKAEIIELAMMPFRYDGSGIAQVLQPLHSYSQPSEPIPLEITKLTGITNEMVAGRKIDVVTVEGFVAAAELVIAHHAAFDRPFLETLSPKFAEHPCACSMSQVAWSEHGIRGGRLEYIAGALGFFYDAHNAVSDCQAGIQVLGATLTSGRTALAHLLDKAFLETKRIWAVGSEFEKRDLLKARGYEWKPGDDGRPKSWHIEVAPDQVETELAYLRKEVYRRPEGTPLGGKISTVTPLTRFTVRG